MIAKETGPEPLADLILLQMTKEPLERSAASYVSEEKGVKTSQEASAGAMDILAERLSEDAGCRTYIRDLTMKECFIRSEAKDEKAQTVYEIDYQ